MTMTATRPRAALRVGLARAEQARDWDRFVSAAPSGHLLQSWEWGEFKARQGWNPARLAVWNPDGAIVAAAGVLFRRPVSHVPISVAYTPRGPVAPLDEAAPARVALEAGLRALCRRRGAVFLKIEPNAPAGIASARALAASGFRPARRIQPRRTIMLDLRPDAPEDSLLAA